MSLLLDLLLPRRCVGCGAAASALCSGCRAALRLLRPPMCARCGAPTVWPVARCRECAGRRLAFASARAAVAYDGPARQLVHAWKERGLRHLAAVAADVACAALEPPAVEVLTHVPPDCDRLLRRGHHPAEQLSRELGRRWGIAAAPLLARAGTSLQQTGLDRAARGRNVRGAFAARARAPTSVALVDDVYTTGATTAAAASALRRAGARRVEVVTFARAVR